MILVLLLVANAVFVPGLAIVYLLVTRRRAKIYVLIEHLAELSRRSLPLATGLRQLAADLKGRLGVRLGRLARLLEDGRPLGEALEAVPGAFPPVARSLISLGERCGNLGEVLGLLRQEYRRMSETSSRTVYFFLYPVFLTIFIGLALAALRATVVPKMMEIMHQMRLLGGFESGWNWLAAVNQGVLLACVGLAAFILAGGGSAHFGASAPRRFRCLLARGTLSVPLLAAIVRDRACAQFALGAALIVRAGGTLAEALRGAAEAERNPLLAEAFARIAARVLEGERFSAAARRERVLPEQFLWFVEAGEAAGGMDVHLRDAAAYYDARARFAAHLASRAVIPFFVVVNGALVLAACLLTFQPMRDVLQKVTPW